MNSPRPRICGSPIRLAMARASMVAPACSNGVAGTQEGIMNLMSSSVRSAARIM